MIAVPQGVSVRKVDLAVELQILAFYEQRKATLAGGASGAAAPWRNPSADYFAIVIHIRKSTARTIRPNRMNWMLP